VRSYLYGKGVYGITLIPSDTPRALTFSVKDIIEDMGEAFHCRGDREIGDAVLLLYIPDEFVMKVFRDESIAFNGYGKRFRAPIDELMKWWYVVRSLGALGGVV